MAFVFGLPSFFLGGFTAGCVRKVAKCTGIALERPTCGGAAEMVSALARPPRNREMTTASNKRGFSRCALACQFFSIGQSTVRVRILLLYQYYSVYRIILVFGRCRRGPRKQSLQFHAAVACLLFTISEHFYRTMQHHLFYFLLLSWSSLYEVNFGWAEWRVGRYHTR